MNSRLLRGGPCRFSGEAHIPDTYLKGDYRKKPNGYEKKYKISVLGQFLTLITNLQSDFLVDAEKPKSANFQISIFWPFTKGPPCVIEKIDQKPTLR